MKGLFYKEARSLWHFGKTYLLMLVIFLGLLLAESIPLHYLWSLIVYLAACFTDTLDGHLARSRNLVTDFGKLMDPLADKLLVMLVKLVGENNDP